jgi:type III pantothenate kinase
MTDDRRDMLAICVGNTRTRVGLFQDDTLAASKTVSSDDAAAIAATAVELVPDPASAFAVIASVNPTDADAIASTLAAALGAGSVARLGVDIPIPIRHSLEDDSTVGQDRLLNALAAFSHASQACVIVDVGTAVTIDFIDGGGIFHGGMILPGLNMMLKAMHEQTAALPVVNFAVPDPARGPLGKDTPHAMTLGVLAAVRGGIRTATEAAAEVCGAYPQIVATGGDMGILEDEGLIEHFVPDLQLLGVLACVKAARGGADGS